MPKPLILVYLKLYLYFLTFTLKQHHTVTSQNSTRASLLSVLMWPKLKTSSHPPTVPRWIWEIFWIVTLTTLMDTTNGFGKSLTRFASTMLSYPTSAKIWTSRTECLKLNVTVAWAEVSIVLFYFILEKKARFIGNCFQTFNVSVFLLGMSLFIN